MPRSLPVLDGAQVVRAFQRLGFAISRIHGSHYILHHTDGRSVTVPVHAGRTLKRGTLHAIIRNAGLTVEQLLGAIA